MGGKILELQTGKAWEEGYKLGYELGLELGTEIKYIMNMYKNGFSLEQIAAVADRTVEEVKQIIENNSN